MVHAEVDPREIDMVVAFSGMGDWDYPKDANLLPKALGLVNAVCWTLDTACASFISALKCAHALIASGLHHRVAIVMCMNWSSRGSRPGASVPGLGDGAAAVIVEGGVAESSLLGVREQSDPEGFDLVMLRSAHAAGELTHFEFSTDPRFRDYLQNEALTVVRELLGETGTSPDSISWMLAHQPSLGTLERWADSLDIDPSRVLSTFATAGNLSAASIPMTLEHYVRQDPRIERGDKLLFYAPGAGMHLAAMLWQY